MSNALARLSAAAAVLLLSALGTITFAAPAAAAALTASTEAELATAINTANGDAAPDTITLTGAGFTLTADLPMITTDIAIAAPGSATFAIQGNALFDAFDIEGLPGALVTVSISGLTIAGTVDDSISAFHANLSLSDVVVGSDGLRHEDGDLAIAGSEFTGSDDTGATVFVYGSQTVVIQDTTFDSNTTVGLDLQARDDTVSTLTNVSAEANGNDGFNFFLVDRASLTTSGLTAIGTTNGNGLDVDAELSATATLTNTVASNNSNDGAYAASFDDASIVFATLSADHNGGDGLDVNAGGGGSVSFTDATVTFNGDNGVESDGDDTGSTITFLRLNSSDNAARGVDAQPAGGASMSFTQAQLRRNLEGGLYVDDDGGSGTFDLINSTIDGNGNASALGGGIEFESDAAIALTVTGSTISNNLAEAGGGIFASMEAATDSLTIVSSTISGNTAEIIGGVLAFAPNGGSPFLLSHSTITDNESTDGYPAVVLDSVEATVGHTIIAANTGGAADADDLVLFGGSLEIDYSLIQDADPSTAPVIAAGTGNIVGFGADLGPLADNGGLTFTHLPSASSRAVDAGDPAITGAPATDQRAAARIVRVIDIGAVEVQPAVALAATGADPTGSLLVGGVAGAAGILLLVVASRRRRDATATVAPIY
ncbi:MAG: polymorphic outer membrane protein [Rhodoglobus sp.]|nr:polymorphic outer membrane protein [Rhodoglobus sp.]